MKVSTKFRTGITSLFVAVVLMLCGLVFASEEAYAADANTSGSNVQLQVTGTNDQTEARQILAMVNNVRAMNKNPNDNSVKTPTAALTWDYNLEKAALQRAAELSILYSHDRPDGTQCFTAFPSGYYAMAENIQVGTGSVSASGANGNWTKSPGHYGNMIDKDVTCMAAAKFTAGGSTYWVELFGKPNSGTAMTAAVNGSKTYSITAAKDILDLSMEIPNATTALKGAVVQATVYNADAEWVYTKTPIDPSSFTWTSSNSNVASVASDGKVTIKSAGQVAITAKLSDTVSASYSFNVSAKAPTSSNTNNQTSSPSTSNSTGKWAHNSKGWWYVNPDGSYAKGLKTIGNAKYYFDNNGWMKTGWQHATGNSDWYYFNKSGAMKTGWTKVSGKWYYMDKSSGIMQKGKLTLSDGTYFLNNNGVMRMGWVQDAGNWYYTNSSGKMKTGWVKSGGKWYYLNEAGVMVNYGFIGIGGKYYHFASNGVMSTGWKKIDGGWYYFASSGAAKQDQWLKSGGKWYYFASDYRMWTGFREIDGKYYYMNDSGVMATGWKKIGSDWRYFNKSGVMQMNKWISGKFWVDDNGIMATNTWVDGGKYYVDAQGKWVKGAKKQEA